MQRLTGAPESFTSPMKTIFVLVLGCEVLRVCGAQKTRERGGLQFTFTMMLRVTVAVFAVGSAGTPTTNYSGTIAITVIGTGPNNQTATAALAVNIHR